MFGISEIKCEARQAMPKEISVMKKREKMCCHRGFPVNTHTETEAKRERENILAIEIDIC